jgi:hypothetical protein
VSVPNLRGFSALMVFSSVEARFLLPQVSGAGATPSAPAGVFRIDHDEKFNQTTHLQYQIGKSGPWAGFNWRYDSGMVAGAVPLQCAPSQYGSTRVTIPAPGTENDDHNPPRIAPRHVFDIELGDDNLFVETSTSGVFV